MQLLDTDVLIDIQRGYPAAIAWFRELEALPSVPGFVVMELIQDSANAVQMQQAMKLVQPFPVVWPSQSDCEQALAYFQRWHLSHSLGLLDALIGACATGVAATLYTFNRKHYQVIPHLHIEQPYQRIG